MRRRVGLGQTVDVVDVETGLLHELVGDRGRDRRTSGVDHPEGGPVLLGHPVQPREVDEHRDRTDGERGLVLTDRVDDHTRFEPVIDHQRAPREQRDPHVADQAGDMEQRRDPEHGVLGSEAHPVPVCLGIERHRAVGAHRTLRHAGGSRGVAQHGHIVRTRIDGHRLAAVVLAEDLLEV